MKGNLARRVRGRATFANVMASAAMFVALGGTSYAAVKITSADVRNNSLRGADVRNGSLSGADIGSSSIRGGDIRDGSLGAADLRTGTVPTVRWLLINEAGDIEEQSGGFTVRSKPGINGQPATNPNIYVDAGSSLVGKGLLGTIAIQNRLDLAGGDGVADPSFQGDVSIARCGSAFVNCVPAGTNVDTVFVVRALADNTAVASAKKRVHVQVAP